MPGSPRTASGSLTGRIAGWGETTNAHGKPVTYLRVETREQRGWKQHYIPAVAILRHLKATDQTPRPAQPALPRCGDCRKILSHFDLEASAVDGYCFNCA